jgi:hypothetical protein
MQMPHLRLALVGPLAVFSTNVALAEKQETEAAPKTLHNPNRTLSRILFDEERSTLFTADLKLSNIADDTANLYGGKVMLMNSNHRQIGLGVHLLPKEMSVSKFGENAKVSFATGGVYLGSEENDRDFIQGWTGIMIGAAKIAATKTKRGDVSSMNLLTEPELGFALKITDESRIGIAISYRGVWGDFSRFGDDNFDAWSANITLRIGDYLRTCERCRM